MPRDLAKKLLVKKEGKVLAGAWVVDNKVSVTCGHRQRLAFHPARPLEPGQYEVSGFPKGVRGLIRTRQTFTVGPERDTTAPTFAGLRGAFCMRPNPLLGCRPYGIGLRPGEAADSSGVRFVTHIRRRGKPYQPEARVETDLLPYNPQGLIGSAKQGWYVLTLRALDAADNAGGRVCEVSLRLPVGSCKSFPGAGPGGKVSIVHGLGTGMIRARCARWSKKKKAWISAIDGVVLRF